MSAPTPEIHHPDQPDGIDEYSADLPDIARAARRVRAWICEWGDGLIQVTNRRPLYARDLEALRRAAESVAELSRKRDYFADLNEVQSTRLEEAWAKAGRDRDELTRLRELERVAREWRATQPPQIADTGVHPEVVALAAAVDALGPDGAVAPTPACPVHTVPMRGCPHPAPASGGDPR